MNRRGFLTRLGLGVAAVAVAPVLPKIVAPTPTAALYIPPERLDMGVPRAILTATEMPTGWIMSTPESMLTDTDYDLWAGPVPMLLVHDEFQPPGWQQFGRQRVPAGTTLMVDRQTAERWVATGVGTPGQMAPLDLQDASAKQWVANAWTNTFIDAESISVVAPIPSVEWPTQATRAKRDDAFDVMVKRATAKAARETGPDWWDKPTGERGLMPKSWGVCRGCGSATYHVGGCDA